MSHPRNTPGVASNVHRRGTASRPRLLAVMAFAILWLVCFPSTADAGILYVVEPTYSTLTLDVETSDTIEAVKAAVQDDDGVAPDSQYLYFGGTLLQDGQTLSDYGISFSSSLSLVATAAFTATPIPNGVWRFGVKDMTAGAGIGWTSWQPTNPVDLSSYGQGGITFNVFGFNGGVAGMPVGYDPSATYLLPFLTSAGGISGFSASQFNVIGAFAERASVVQSGNSLLLRLGTNAVPEIDPSSMGSVIALIGAGLGLLERRRLRRR